ncbi:MAG: GatB/YqeY domain-containing protein [Alphaproteobacteria bacterium]|nr:GatB/YqeY domain-containing protein [Alphaproteobacteria bacterium]
MLRTQLNEALKSALKSQDKVAVSTIRLILAALKDREIAVRPERGEAGLEDDEILQLLQKMVKQRDESIALYLQGGRQDLVDRERAEVEVINRFLPKQMEGDELRQAVETVVGEADASNLKDMGRVMAALRERYAGRMDFAKASGIVKEMLG